MTPLRESRVTPVTACARSSPGRAACRCAVALTVVRVSRVRRCGLMRPRLRGGAPGLRGGALGSVARARRPSRTHRASKYESRIEKRTLDSKNCSSHVSSIRCGLAPYTVTHLTRATRGARGAPHSQKRPRGAQALAHPTDLQPNDKSRLTLWTLLSPTALTRITNKRPNVHGPSCPHA